MLGEDKRLIRQFFDHELSMTTRIKTNIDPAKLYPSKLGPQFDADRFSYQIIIE